MEPELKTSEELEFVKAKIYDIDGEKVIFDFDLARLYGIETKVLNQAVKRNLTRFPADFMIYVDNQRLNNLKSHFVTSSWGGSRKGAYAFTEHGVAMLSSVLRSPVAVQINIMIMRDQNDINENTRFRLDMIERALAEMHPKDNDRSRKIGFKQNADV